MLQRIGYGTYIIFGLLTFMGAGFIWFFVPETKRLTLEEMVRVLSRTDCIVWVDKLLELNVLTKLLIRTSSSDPKARRRPTSSAWRRLTARLA